jgi:hypothetical protein
MRSRIQVRIRIEVKSWIQIRSKVKSWIRIRIKVMRLRNPAHEYTKKAQHTGAIRKDAKGCTDFL